MIDRFAPGPKPEDDTTGLLRRWSDGERAAGEELLQRLYPQLRRVARRERRRWDLSLETSDLLHDAWLRALAQRALRWQNRSHFFALVARWIRQTTQDAALGRSRLKRDPRRKQALDGVELSIEPPSLDRLVLDQALRELATLDPIASRVVELLFYSGLTVNETAAALELGRATVTRRWRFARAWLQRRLASA